jgi:flagellar biosynthesis protein FlhA
VAEVKANTFSLHMLGDYTDLVVASGIIGILLVMIIPLPSSLLDMLLAFNITLALVTLLVSIYTIRPLEFSIFPSLLLMLTLFRLSLNVSSTRLILLYGNQGVSAAGEVIRSFGSFVVGGNFVVGIIIFSILVLINFVVITKGAGRIAEVAARFTLDAMPGKQMAIDADLNAGMISEEDARKRREEVQQAADFYGAMDGASKFVRGDAIAGILITFVNALGGIVIGIFQQGLDIRNALQSYTILTVGDGLVSQIPALIISTAAGIVVTKASAELNLSDQIKSQFLIHPRPIGTVSGILFVLGLVPGLPQFPLLTLAVLSGATAYYLSREQQIQRAQEAKTEEMEETQQTDEFNPEQALAPIDVLELEVGYALIPLVDSGQQGDLLDRIKAVRRQVVQELGVIVPPLRIRDNLQLKSGEYAILIKGTAVASGELMMGHYLAMHPGDDVQEVIGIPTIDPAFGLAASWIEEEQKEQAQFAGYTVVDPSTVIVTHLTEIIKRHIHELLNREDVQKLLDRFAQEYPKVVEELVPNQLTLGGVQKVLQNLLREQISIRDFLTILETLADNAAISKDPLVLTEYVRQSLSRAITHKLLAESGELPVIMLSFDLETTLSKSLHQTEHGAYLSLDPQLAQRLISELVRIVEQVVLVQHHTPILITSPMVRPHLKRLTEPVLPQLVVLSQSEVMSNVSIKNLAVVRI